SSSVAASESSPSLGRQPISQSLAVRLASGRPAARIARIRQSPRELATQTLYGEWSFRGSERRAVGAPSERRVLDDVRVCELARANSTGGACRKYSQIRSVERLREICQNE